MNSYEKHSKGPSLRTFDNSLKLVPVILYGKTLIMDVRDVTLSSLLNGPFLPEHLKLVS